jgi:ribosome biogenesis protein ERB1
VGQNTVGKIPMEWYQDFPHIGYDVNGKKIFKPAFGDNLEKFLDSLDNPDFGSSFKFNFC